MTSFFILINIQLSLACPKINVKGTKFIATLQPPMTTPLFEDFEPLLPSSFGYCPLSTRNA